MSRRPRNATALQFGGLPLKESRVGANLIAAREAFRWRQEHLANLLRVTQSTISLWEANKILPSGTAQVAIACLFGCTVAEIHRDLVFTAPFRTSIREFERAIPQAEEKEQ